MVGLLQLIIDGDIHIAEFLITPCFHMCTELSGSMIPSHEGMRNASNSSLEKVVF
jgi:hypothetical protein